MSFANVFEQLPIEDLSNCFGVGELIYLLELSLTKLSTPNSSIGIFAAAKTPPKANLIMTSN